MSILIRDPLSQIDVCRHILSIQVAQIGSKHRNGGAVITVVTRKFNVLGAVLEVLSSPFEPPYKTD